jgi:hypothetical protein
MRYFLYLCIVKLKEMSNNQKAKVMEKKMYAIKVVADGFSGVTTAGTGVPHRVPTRYCEYYLPFFGTKEEAKAAALGLGEGCARQVKKFYDSGCKTVELDGEVIIDSAI